jgi:UDP-N-acetylglucosamine 2-epimerase (non-hydrolysing)
MGAEPMKISIVLGTRPEIIKMSPIIHECERLGLNYFILHSGQHYNYNMSQVFLKQLGLPEAKYNLQVGSGTHTEQIRRILVGVKKVLSTERPDIVLVEGDTNTVLAGALAAIKLGVKVGHVEAGLRSYDPGMPEEVNRVLTDHCSDLLFAPTAKSKKILLREGIPRDRIFITGNTIVDVIVHNLESSRDVVDILGLSAGNYFLMTVHRQENVDNPRRFREILRGMDAVRKEFRLPVIYPIHPRAWKQMSILGYKTEGIRLLDPLDYFSFLQLERNARLIFTDSGGIQEEACILGVPCVTLRDNTERPETLDVGANVLIGAEPEEIVKKTKVMLSRSVGWANPFGDGRAGEKIVKIIRNELS